MTARALRPFRFAVQSYRTDSPREWRDRARRVEELGYSTLHVADHYIGPGPMLDSTKHRVQTVAAVPALAVAAEATTTLRIGSRMFCVGYHQPVVLAKEAATLDFFSEGRLEVGLGAGWLENEYAAMGIPFERAGARIDALRETVDLLRQSFAGGQVEVNGTHVRVHGFEAVPRPVQQPGPPLMIGGGAPRVLRTAGELADIVSINYDNRSGQLGTDSVATSGADETAAKVGWVLEGAGDRADQIELEIAAYFVSIDGRSEAGSGETAARAGLDVEGLRTFPHGLIGSVAAVCDELVRRREVYGFSYITIGDTHLEAFAPVVERLAGT